MNNPENPYNSITESMSLIDDPYDNDARVARNIKAVAEKSGLTFEQVRTVLFYNFEQYLKEVEESFR